MKQYTRQKKLNKLIGFLLLFFWATIGWAQEDIKFTYEFKRDNSNPSIVNVTAKIINNSTENIYFLSESCNGLDYFLTTTSDLARILSLIKCSVTLPIKIKLKANSVYKFETIIQLDGEVEKIGLNLNLVRLSKSTKIKELAVDEIKKENAHRTMILEGPIKKIE